MSSCVRNQLSENRSLLINSATTRHTGSGQALTCSLNPFPISPGSFIKNVAGPKTRRLFLSHQSLRVSTLLCSQVPVSQTRVGVSDRCAHRIAADFSVPMLVCFPAPFLRYSSGERLRGLPGGRSTSFHEARVPHQRKFPIQFVQHWVFADCMRQRSV